MKTINTLLLSFCILTGVVKASMPRLPDSAWCLELQGKISINENKKASCNVIITSINASPDTFILSQGKLKAFLQRDASYTLTITKPGYASKTILINTAISADLNGVYRFSFDATLKARERSACSGPEENPPVAIIYFDKKRGYFYYSKFNRCLPQNLAGK